MRLLETRTEVSDGRIRLVARMESAGGRGLPDGWFEYGQEYASFVREDADVFVPVLLAASMMTREAFSTGLPVSSLLAQNVETVCAIFRRWFPDECEVFEPEFGDIVQKESAGRRGVGAFFSAGVDSFHTILSEKAGLRRGAGPVTHLVYLRGVETALGRMASGKAEAIARLAGELGYPLITGVTNLRDCFDHLRLSGFYGSMMASVALSLSGGLRAMLVPAGGSYEYKDLHPHGAHPLLDRQWSTEYMDIRDDGSDTTRAERTALTVAKSPLALENLSVCIRKFGAFENCGVCPKCVRTAITLQALGALEKCGTLPSPFDYRLIDTLNIKDLTERLFLAESLEAAEETGHDPKLARILRRRLRRYEKYTALVTLARGTVFHPPARALRAIAKRLLKS